MSRRKNPCRPKLRKKWGMWNVKCSCMSYEGQGFHDKNEAVQWMNSHASKSEA